MSTFCHREWTLELKWKHVLFLWQTKPLKITVALGKAIKPGLFVLFPLSGLLVSPYEPSDCFYSPPAFEVPAKNSDTQLPQWNFGRRILFHAPDTTLTNLGPSGAIDSPKAGKGAESNASFLPCCLEQRLLSSMVLFFFLACKKWSALSMARKWMVCPHLSTWYLKFYIS